MEGPWMEPEGVASLFGGELHAREHSWSAREELLLRELRRARAQMQLGRAVVHMRVLCSEVQYCEGLLGGTKWWEGLTKPLKLKGGDEGCWYALHGNGTATIVGFLYFTLGGVTMAMKADGCNPVGSWAELSRIAGSGFGEAAGKAFDTQHPEHAEGAFYCWKPDAIVPLLSPIVLCPKEIAAISSSNRSYTVALTGDMLPPQVRASAALSLLPAGSTVAQGGKHCTRKKKKK